VNSRGRADHGDTPRRHELRHAGRAPVAAPVPAPPRRANADRGASLAEYALLVGLVAIVAIGALRLLGDRTSDSFDDVAAATVAGTGDTGPSSGGGGNGGGGNGGGRLLRRAAQGQF